MSHESDVVSESLSELTWENARELLIHEANAQGFRFVGKGELVPPRLEPDQAARLLEVMGPTLARFGYGVDLDTGEATFEAMAPLASTHLPPMPFGVPRVVMPEVEGSAQ